MGTKGIRLKMLLPLMVVIVLAEASGSQVQLDPEINLPSIVFRKEQGTPVKFRGATFQKNLCAAFPVADGTFLTSAHCLATAPITNGLDLVGLGNAEIEKIETHPKFDLTVFQLKNRNLVPGSRHVGLNSDVLDDTCTVLVLDKDFRWTILHGATPTRCQDNASKDKICFKTEKIPTGLDFAVVCEAGRSLHAVFHGQRGAEVSFTVCSAAHCSELVKQGATTRVKRQSEDDITALQETYNKAQQKVTEAENELKGHEEDPAKKLAVAAAKKDAAEADVKLKEAAAKKARKEADEDTADTAKKEAADAAETAALTAAQDLTAAEAALNALQPGKTSDPSQVSQKDGEQASDKQNDAPQKANASDPNDSSAPAPAPTGDVPLPPPTQLFPNMPKNFPYPTIEVVQSPPVPTRPRKRPGFQNPYPVQAPKENPFPELPAMAAMTPNQPIHPVQEQPSPVVANAGDVSVSVQLPIRTESPDTADLTEYEVLGTQDAPVLAANNDVKAVEAPEATPQPVADPQQVDEPPQVAEPEAPETVPVAVQQRVQRPSSGGFAMAPADWRYSVTPKPQRRCKTTTSRPACRAQPNPDVMGPHGAPPMGAANYPEQMYQPNTHVMGPPGTPMMGAANHPEQMGGAAGARRPVGPDPWMGAAQEAVPTGLVQRKDEKRKATKKPPAPRGSAVRNGLAVVALVMANVLHFLM